MLLNMKTVEPNLILFLIGSLFAQKMNSFGGDREPGRDEKNVKHSAGRGHRVWLQGDSGGLRRPHSSSTASQSSIS